MMCPTIDVFHSCGYIGADAIVSVSEFRMRVCVYDKIRRIRSTVSWKCVESVYTTISIDFDYVRGSCVYLHKILELQSDREHFIFGSVKLNRRASDHSLTRVSTVNLNQRIKYRLRTIFY